jgi:methylglutaconyl-CoA hydratase
MTPQMQLELTAALNEAAQSPCRVLVLTGAGESFCSGLDLTVLQSMQQATTASHQADAHRIATLFRTLYDLPKPTIAAVNGPAIAGGAGLATICDFTLATPTSTFGYTEARIGFLPAIVSAFLTLQIGDKRARDLLLTARILDADESYRIGLINEVVTSELILTRVGSLAKSLAANSPASVSATKNLLSLQHKPWLDAALAAAMDANVASRETLDFREGLSAFLEKRAPNWC